MDVEAVETDQNLPASASGLKNRFEEDPRTAGDGQNAHLVNFFQRSRFKNLKSRNFFQASYLSNLQQSERDRDYLAREAQYLKTLSTSNNVLPAPLES